MKVDSYRRVQNITQYYSLLQNVGLPVTRFLLVDLCKGSLKLMPDVVGLEMVTSVNAITLKHPAGMLRTQLSVLSVFPTIHGDEMSLGTKYL